VPPLQHAPLHPGAGPAGHWQAPDVQVAPVAHALGQLPQCASSVWRFTQALSQTDSPDGQRQAPAVQVWRARQGVPH
jgi:hypothetical protein